MITNQVKKYKANWWKTNKAKVRVITNRWRTANKEQAYEATKRWRLKNRKQINEYNRKYKTERLATDSLFKCRVLVRGLIYHAIDRMRYKKNTKTEKILGCSFSEFKTYIEAKFTKGMSWDNHKEWHLDHIIPLASAKTEDTVIKLNHYTNLQPLWATSKIAEKYGEENYVGNLEKSDKLWNY